MEQRTPRGRAVITVNGERRTVEAGSLQELLEQLGLGTPRGGIAIAVNSRVVSRSRWGEQQIDDGDRVEIVGAVQGG